MNEFQMKVALHMKTNCVSPSVNICFLIICSQITCPISSCATKAVFVCKASCQHTLPLLQSKGRTGVSGAGWVTEGLMLALGEP